jgi:hypothetical protein
VTTKPKRPKMPMGRPTAGPEKLDERVAMLLSANEKDRLVTIALAEGKTISTLLRESLALRFPELLEGKKPESKE